MALNHSFNTQIATLYDVNQAIMLENLYFWVSKNKANGKHLHDGYYWTYNSATAFQELFPYWTARQIEGILKKLKDNGLVISGNYNSNKFDKTNWYTLTDKALNMYKTDFTHLRKNVNGCCEASMSITDINNTDINNIVTSVSNISEIPLGINKCSNSHLNERFSPNGKGNGKRSFESTHELGELTDDMEISSVMQYYDAVYTNSIGRSHPRIKAEQLEQLNKKLGELMGELILEVDEVNTMIDYFFEHPPKNCDMNINVFLTNGVFVRVGYSAKVISGYTDEINY